MFVVLALALGCARDVDSDTGGPATPWTAPDVAGPYAAGVTTWDYTDARGKAMTVEVWYPAAPADGDQPDTYEVPITGTAYRDAPAEPGPWPLIAFSHGNSGVRYQSVFLTEHLAQHGFVVVAPDHTFNTFLDYDSGRTVQVMQERPGDVASAVDEALAVAAGEGPLAGFVDDAHYAVVGHSFGGWTAMAVGGGVLNRAEFEAHCASSPDALCGLVGDLPDDLVPPEPDPRAVVTVPMTPCGWYTFGDDGLSTLVPSLYLGGDRDPICPVATEVAPAFERSRAPSTLATLPLAGHFAFSDLCRMAPFVSDECDEQDAGYGVIAEEQLAIRALVTAWVGVNFAHDERYAPWLAAQLPSDFTVSTR